MRSPSLFLVCLVSLANLHGGTWPLDVKPSGLALLPTVTSPFEFPADDLERIVDPRTTPTERGAAYVRLTHADFAAIARKLASLMGAHPVVTGFAPRTRQPWTESQLSEGDRIGCTLSQLWEHHVATRETRARYTGVLLDILEQPLVADPAPSPPAEGSLLKERIYDGREAAILQIKLRLHYWRDDPAMPPLAETLARLDRLVRDPFYPLALRQRILPILVEHGDPNRYLDLAIELAAAEKTPLRRGAVFCSITPTQSLDKLTPENRARYLRHALLLLEDMDDGKSGRGYFLAMHIGCVAGVPPTPPEDSPFVPDRGIPKYDEPHRLAESFFQDTVRNARAWWEENKALYPAP